MALVMFLGLQPLLRFPALPNCSAIRRLPSQRLRRSWAAHGVFLGRCSWTFPNLSGVLWKRPKPATRCGTGHFRRSEPAGVGRSCSGSERGCETSPRIRCCCRGSRDWRRWRSWLSRVSWLVTWDYRRSAVDTVGGCPCTSPALRRRCQARSPSSASSTTSSFARATCFT